MGGHHCCELHALQQIVDLGCVAVVKRGDGFIQLQQLGLLQQSSGQVQQLTLAGAEIEPAWIQYLNSPWECRCSTTSSPRPLKIELRASSLMLG